LNIKRVRLK